MDRLGITVNELANRVGMDCETIARARDGRAQSATYGAIEAWLDQIETTTGLDIPDPIVSTVTFPDGTTVVFEGTDSAGIADVIDKLLRKRGKSAG
jgi:predicted transcriptional regulator